VTHIGSTPRENQNHSPIALHASQEEKKMEDESRRGPAEAPGKYLTFRADGQALEDPPPATSRPNSDVDPSVAHSGTTVMRNNNSITRKLDEKSTIHNHKQQQPQSQAGSWKKKKNGRERPSPEGGGPVNPPAVASNRHSPRQSPSGHGLPKSDSGVSLEYSMDSSMFDASSGGGQSYGEQSQPQQHRPVGGSSMMMQYAEASQSSIRGARNSRKAPEARQRQQPQQPQVTTVTDEDESLSLQESGSSEVIPTDEELFVVGWAKALDPRSGNYYYFTLDRTKTVWENPLSSDTFVSGESSYLSGSASSRQQAYQRQASR
jgi:hypothetical protein